MRLNLATDQVKNYRATKVAEKQVYYTNCKFLFLFFDKSIRVYLICAEDVLVSLLLLLMCQLPLQCLRTLLHPTQELKTTEGKLSCRIIRPITVGTKTKPHQCVFQTFLNRLTVCCLTPGDWLFKLLGRKWRIRSISCVDKISVLRWLSHTNPRASTRT